VAILSVNVNDLSNQLTPNTGVGTVSAEQLGTILAQKSKTVANTLGVDATSTLSTISSTTGVGKYGISPNTLEKSGFLKPGTVDRYLDDPAQISTVLNSQSVWTGKDGINSVNNLLGDEVKQTDIMTTAFNTSLKDLQSANILTGSESPDVVGSITNVASSFGVDNTKSWLNNDIADAAMGLDMDNLARAGGYSVDFALTKASSLLSSGISQLTSMLDSGTISSAFSQLASSVGGVSAIQGAAGQLLGGASDALDSVMGSLSSASGDLSGAFGSLFGGVSNMLSGGAKVKPARVIVPPAVTQTVNRAAVDEAMTALIGNAKVAAPNYTGLVNASAFSLPSLSGLSNFSDNIAQEIGNGGPVEICRCIGADELISPTKSECEAAGGTWSCRTVNTTIET
jgi:hypothetical protein